jgi:hypothetical protein
MAFVSVAKRALLDKDEVLKYQTLCGTKRSDFF